MKISILTGSMRPNSITFRVGLFLEKHLSTATGHNINLIDIRKHPFPPIQYIVSKLPSPSEDMKKLSEQLHQSDALIFVSPEYNGSYSPILKNAIDHFDKIAYARKAIGIVTASEGAMGGIRAALQLQHLVCALFAIPAPQMLTVPQVEKKFSPEGELIEVTYQPAIDRFTRDFIWLAESLYKNK